MSESLRRRTILRGIGASAALSVASGPAVSRADTVENLKVGILVDLSGPTMLHGQRQLAGIEFAAERINQNPGRRGVTLAVRDTRGDLTEAERAARELIAAEAVRAMVGPSTSRTAPPIIELTGQAGIPLVMPNNGNEKALAQNHVFRSGPASRQVVAVMIADLVRTGHRRVAIVAGDNFADNEWIRLFTPRLEGTTLSLTGVERYLEPVTDLMGPITRAMATKPDALIFRGMPPNNGIAAREARTAGWTGSLYLGAAAATPMFLAGAGPAGEGARVIAHWALIPRKAPQTLANYREMTDFVADFEQARGPIGTFACYGADALMLIHRAARQSTDPAEIRAALEQGSFRGVTGSYRFSPARHAGLREDDVIVLTVANGAWMLAT